MSAASEFFASRAEWFEVMIIPGSKRGGVEIVLRIDGTYFHKGDTKGLAHMQEYWEEALAEVCQAEGIPLPRGLQ